MNRVIHVTTTVPVVVPEGATHYVGELTDDPEFYKCTQVGVVGDHWWYYNKDTHKWMFCQHTKPSWLKELPEEKS